MSGRTSGNLFRVCLPWVTMTIVSVDYSLSSQEGLRTNALKTSFSKYVLIRSVMSASARDDLTKYLYILVSMGVCLIIKLHCYMMLIT